MLLAIDVGNTQTVFGVYDGDSLLHMWRVATEKRDTSDELRNRRPEQELKDDQQRHEGQHDKERDGDAQRDREREPGPLTQFLFISDRSFIMTI